MKKHQETNEVPRRVRGSLLVRGDDSYEFTPYAEGESTQEVLRQRGKSKIYRTKGKQPLMVAYLTVPADSVDPRAEIMEQVDKLTRDMQSKAKPRMRGKVLMDEDNARVTLSTKESRLEMVLGIDLKATPDYYKALMNLMYKLNQCFTINQSSLVSARQ